MFQALYRRINCYFFSVGIKNLKFKIHDARLKFLGKKMLYSSLVTYGKLQGLFFAWIVHRERVTTFYGGGQVSEETQLSGDLHKHSRHKS